MSHLQAYNNSTKNYKLLATQFENATQDTVDKLVAERNLLKKDNLVQKIKIDELQAANLRLTTENEVLKEKLNALQKNSEMSEFYARAAFAVAQNLTNDVNDLRSEREFLLTAPPPLSGTTSQNMTPVRPTETPSNHPIQAVEVVEDVDHFEEERIPANEADVPANGADASNQSGRADVSVVLNL